MWKNYFLVIVLFLGSVFIQAQNSGDNKIIPTIPEDNLWDALQNNRHYMFVVASIDNHNLYVRTPYFTEIEQKMNIEKIGVIEKAIIITLPEKVIMFMYSNSTGLLYNKEEGFIVFPVTTKDGLTGFFEFIDTNIGKKGYNPLTIKRER